MVLRRNYFAVAGIITSVIFISGILVGIELDTVKIEEVHSQYKETELEWYDIQLQSDYYKFYPNVEDYCDIMIQSNLEFSDRVYERGLEIERYEEQSKLLKSVRQDKREYALLKFQFWLNAIKLREQCGADYNTLIYFYKDNPTEPEDIQQNAESYLLLELKQEYGQNLILVPMAVDLDVESVNLLVKQFDIQQVPSIVINEEIVLSGIVGREAIVQELNRASIRTVA